MPTFDTLALSPAQHHNLQSLGYDTMTEIQAATLPLILEGGDLIAQAKTGSGKTAAFGLGVMHRLNPTLFSVQALVLCPTRELADQVANELRRLARAIPNTKILSLCGGSPIRPQIESLEHGAHIVVGTPGRVMDHLERGTLTLSRLKMLVLDEADRMVDMGFFEDMVYIASQCPQSRQTLLFSATYPDNIRKLSARFLNNPKMIALESHHDSSQIEQRFYEVEKEDRLEVVARVLKHIRPSSALVFCNTKVQCYDLEVLLNERGIHALTLSGDLEQRDRDDVLIQFSNQSCPVLVATDVAARGLDIQALDLVVNVDVTPDPEVHVHRIGRTGRAGAQGLAVNLVAPYELKWIMQIEKHQGKSVVWSDTKNLNTYSNDALIAPMVTLCVLGGKKNKLRPGDFLGALTKEAGIDAKWIGKINIGDQVSHIALHRSIAKEALTKLRQGQIKGRTFRMRFIGEQE